MISKISLCAALLPALVMSACSNAEQADITTVVIEGEINTELLSAFENMPDHVRNIEITSQGGDTKTAIQIGRIIAKDGYALKVKKYCLSACAQWIVPAAKSIEIEDEAIVAMHVTSTWLRNILIASDDMESAEKLSELAGAEEAFYTELGIDPAFLVYPYTGKQAVCYTKGIKETDFFPVIVSNYDHVILDRETYARFTGQKLTGYWPKAQDEILSSMKKNFPPTVDVSVAFEANPGAGAANVAKIPICSTEQLNQTNAKNW